MNYELTPAQKKANYKRSNFWRKYDSETKRAAPYQGDYSAQQAYLRRREAHKRQKVFTDATICYRYITDRMYEKTRCINYYVYYDHYAYIELSWAIKIGIPHTAWYEDDAVGVVTLTPYGLQWVLRYLLRKHGVLISRPLTQGDLFILEEKRKK